MADIEKRLNYVPAVLTAIEAEMTPLEFISTNAVQKWLERRAKIITGNSDVNVTYEKLFKYSYTDGESIKINPELIAEYADDLKAAFRLMTAAMFHEALHISKTDMAVAEQYINGYIEGVRLPGKNLVYKIYRKHVIGFLEDGAIENLGKREYRGILSECAEFADRVFFSKRPSLKEYAEGNVKELDIFTEAMQTYMIMRIDPVFPDKLSELEKIYYKLRPMMDEIINTKRMSDRCLICEQIYTVLLPYIDKYLGLEEYYPAHRPILPSGHNDMKSERQKRNEIIDNRQRKRDLDFEDEFKEVLSAAVREIYDNRVDNAYSDKLLQDILHLQNTGLGAFHKNIKIDFLPVMSEEFMNYHEIHRRRVISLRSRIRILLKQFMESVQKMHDDTERRLFAGNRYLEPFRADKKVCGHRSPLSEEADLFVYVTVDASGSMNFDIENVKNAITVLTEVCREMNIPVTIASHRADDDTVKIQMLTDANMRRNSFDGIESYKASGSTREGVALMAAVDYLKKRNETQQLLISISDGKPWHEFHIEDDDELHGLCTKLGINEAVSENFFDEYGNFAKYDIRNILKNSGIEPVGIALAQTMPEAKRLYNDIKNLYPQAFATDLGHLSRELSRVIEKSFFDQI